MEPFIIQLLQDKGLPVDLDPEVRDQVVSDLSERALKLVNKRIIETLSPEAATSLERLIDENPDDIEAQQQFIAEHVPNQQEIATQALLEFRELYLGTKA